MATVEEIKKLFPDYFSKNYRGQLDEDIIQKILKLYEEEKIGSNKISKRLLKENKLNINQGVIGRILKRARKNNLVRTIPKKELTAVTEQIVQGKNRKINNVVREVTVLDRKQNPDIPVNAKYKIVFATPQGKTTKIPNEFIGVKYFNTKAEANTALSKRLTADFKTPEDPDASKLKRQRTRNENVKAVTKGSSAADKANIKAIEGGISEINKYFKKDPDLINTTPFGKNIKAMMSLRLDKNTGNFYSKLRPDSYYLDKAKEGQLFDLFDINPVAGKKPGGRFATNVNISPNQFNRAFIGAQLSNFFNKGVNQETASQLDSILKERNIRVDLPNIGKVGASGADVAFDSTTGSFPRIIKTLETMEAPEVIKNLFKSIAELKPGSKSYKRICSLPLANGGGVAGCIQRIAEDPVAAANKLKNLDAQSGPLAKVKNSSTKFLTALKENPNLLRGGLPGKIALGLGTVAAGVGAGALVKQFRNDDPSTYLTNDSQMEGMIISDVEDKGKEVDDNILLDNQFKLELAGAAGLTAPIAKSVYQKSRYSTPPLLESPLEFDQELKTLKRTIRQITHPKGKKAKTISQAGQEVLRNSRIRVNQINEAMSAAKAGKEGSGIFRSALGLEKGVLGKGLWALGAPAIAVPATIGYIAQDIRAGKDAGEIATNPLNYLGAAFMNPAVKALTKAGASRGLLGIASLGLAGTAAGAVALPAISIGAGLATLGTLGYQGYKLFSGNNKSDEDFFR